MRKFALLALAAAALAVPSIAAADTAAGKLTGSATFGGNTFQITSTVVDGGTSSVGLENDKSGTCVGDSGTIVINLLTVSVACAHYVASSHDNGNPKMRLAYSIGPGYQIARIADNGPVNQDTGLSPDTFAIGQVLVSAAQARDWVNKGAIGSGVGFGWAYQGPLDTGGDYTITP